VTVNETPNSEPQQLPDGIYHVVIRARDGDIISVGHLNGDRIVPSDGHPLHPSISKVNDRIFRIRDEVARSAADEWVAEHLAAINWHEVWADDSDMEWVVYPIIPAGRLIAIYSPPKAGKSLLVLEIVAAVACGRSVLGNPPAPPRTVLYVDFENDPRDDIRERLTDMGYGPDDLDRLKYLSFPSIDALDTHEGGQQLLAAARYHQAQLVVIDTVSRTIAGEENDNSTWLNFYRHTGMALKAAGISLIRLDHSGKDPSKGQRGGSAKSGDVDAIWRLTVVPDTDDVTLTLDDARFPVAPENKTLLLHRRLDPLRHDIDPNGARGAWVQGVDRAVALLDDLGIDPSLGRRKARAAITAAGKAAPRDSTLQAAIQERRNRHPQPFTDPT
jgi:hypothetical protein